MIRSGAVMLLAGVAIGDVCAVSRGALSPPRFEVASIRPSPLPPIGQAG